MAEYVCGDVDMRVVMLECVVVMVKCVGTCVWARTPRSGLERENSGTVLHPGVQHLKHGDGL